MNDVKSTLGKTADHAALRSIKASQFAVYEHLRSVAGEPSLIRTKAYPDYWNPEPSPALRTTFGIRVYRRGKWPTLKKRRNTGPGGNGG